MPKVLLIENDQAVRDGLEVALRRQGHKVTSAANGLEAGADDYVVKPVQPRVLDARIRAALRRTERETMEAESHGTWSPTGPPCR